MAPSHSKRKTAAGILGWIAVVIVLLAYSQGIGVLGGRVRPLSGWSKGTPAADPEPAEEAVEEPGEEQADERGEVVPPDAPGTKEDAPATPRRRGVRRRRKAEAPA